jgi:hypothetical protein
MASAPPTLPPPDAILISSPHGASGDISNMIAETFGHVLPTIIREHLFTIHGIALQSWSGRGVGTFGLNECPGNKLRLSNNAVLLARR